MRVKESVNLTTRVPQVILSQLCAYIMDFRVPEVPYAGMYDRILYYAHRLTAVILFDK